MLIKRLGHCSILKERNYTDLLKSEKSDMADNSPIPGLLFSNTRISRPDILTEEVYLKWYFGEHIPDVSSSLKINSKSMHLGL